MTDTIKIAVLLLFLTSAMSPATCDAAEPSDETRDRWMLLLCGLPGDEPHRERLTDAVLQIVAAAEPVFDVPAGRLRLLVGDAEMSDAVRSEIPDAGVCTRESTEETLQELATKVRPEDSFWVVILGHAQFHGGRSTFNVQGPDYGPTEFANWMQPISAEQKVLIITTPVSGYWVKPLSGPGTVIITATEAGPEFTGTEMPYALADIVVGRQQDQPLEDIDEDGQITLRDLYLATTIEVHQRFQAMERLKTEHALLDDGDGIGREIQKDYLPEDDQETPKPGNRRPEPPSRSLAAEITLNPPPIDPAEETDEAEQALEEPDRDSPTPTEPLP